MRTGGENDTTWYQKGGINHIPGDNSDAAKQLGMFAMDQNLRFPSYSREN